MEARRHRDCGVSASPIAYARLMKLMKLMKVRMKV